MPLELHPHPDHPCPALAGLGVTLSRSDGLTLRYELLGDIGQLAIPADAPPGPADELWRHTCCELFIASSGDGYREFNFSPSGQWAAYEFSGYRQRVLSWQPSAAPIIRTRLSGECLLLEAHIPASLIPADTQRLALTAVIEDRTGRIGYWSLHHPAGKPDFHHPEGFALAFPEENQA